MKKYWAEFLGTYILVFVGCGAIIIKHKIMARVTKIVFFCLDLCLNKRKFIVRKR